MAKNRSELVAEVAEKSGLTQKQVSDVLDGVFESFSEAVASGEKLTVPGWLSVERTERAARKGLGIREAFFGKGNFIRFVIAVVIFILQQWGGQNSVNYYAPQIFQSVSPG